MNGHFSQHSAGVDSIDNSDTAISASITRTVPSHCRPFAGAVVARCEPSSAARAAGAWRELITDLVGIVSVRWTDGLSIDLLDGDVDLVADSATAAIEVRVNAPFSEIEPMHIRSLMQVVAIARPAMRREAPISTVDLDAIAAEVVLVALRRYPIEQQPDHRAALARLHRRYGWNLDLLASAA
jgi:hypothetical protein